jgi:hypothetical protein
MLIQPVFSSLCLFKIIIMNGLLVHETIVSVCVCVCGCFCVCVYVKDIAYIVVNAENIAYYKPRRLAPGC